MFVIFGSPRSGTTLLASTLDVHSQVIVPHESDFIIPLAFICDRVKDESIGKQLVKRLIVSTDGFQASIGQYLSESDIDHVVDISRYTSYDLVSGIYTAIANKSGAVIAGDKSPNDLMFLRILSKTGMINSRIRIIHVVRDIRDVVTSLKRTTWAPPDVEEYFPRFWSSSNLYLYNLCKSDLERYCLIRYEDMVRDPEVAFRRMTALLGVGFEEEMLNSASRGRRYKGSIDHGNIAQPFLVERAGAWRARIDSELRRLCEKQAGEGLEEFGYM